MSRLQVITWLNKLDDNNTNKHTIDLLFNVMLKNNKKYKINGKEVFLVNMHTKNLFYKFCYDNKNKK